MTPHTPAYTKPANILIIDDESIICDGCRLALAGETYAIDTCDSGKTGISMFRETDYDLVLLDMKLRDSDGMDLLNLFHKEKPNVAVVVMTGYSTVQNAVQAMKSGARDYLAKPFSDDELIISVEKAIANKRLAEENLALRKQLYERFDFSHIIGENPKLKSIFHKVDKAAPTDTTILIEGESGTGKELFAKAVHSHSRRLMHQFVVVDCSTFSSSLIESELFGHVKGAFTGAVQNKAGIFEIADGGTLFLDEVANLSWDIQGKLLRVMEDHEYKPVGATQIKKTDIRIIAATNKNLKTLVDDGQFREDLYYRLNVFQILLPPLRERKDDIPRLAYHFLRIFSRDMGRRIDGFSDEALALLTNFDWPGNVRQLRNVIERLVIMADQKILDRHHLISNLQFSDAGATTAIPKNIEELKALKKKIIENAIQPMEKSFLTAALTSEKGNITRAAKRVGMQRSNFSALLKKHNLSIPRSNG